MTAGPAETGAAAEGRPSPSARNARRVLFLSWWNPIPPDIGGRARVLALLRALVAEGYETGLISFADTDAEIPGSVARLAELGVRAAFVARSIHDRSRAAQVLPRLGAMFGRRPYNAWVSDDIRMRRELSAAVGSLSPAFVLAETSWMGQYLAMARGSITILSAPNVDFDHYARRAASETNPILRPIRRRHWRSVRQYELEIVAEIHSVITVTDEDRNRYLQAGVSTPIHVLPITVDTDRCRFATPPDTGESRLLFLGAMYYQPNVEAMVHFCREIYPLVRREIPDARLIIAGSRPAPAIRELAAADPSISVTGHVADLSDCYRGAEVFVAPIRFGGGMKTKIVESMAFGLPVVGYPSALEGIPAVDGVHALIRDTPRAFADAVVALCRNAGLRAKIRGAARQLAEERFSDAALRRGLRRILEIEAAR
jgi:glycosyltransferase involved in cell wall biosynthesis